MRHRERDLMDQERALLRQREEVREKLRRLRHDAALDPVEGANLIGAAKAELRDVDREIRIVRRELRFDRDTHRRAW